MTDREFWKSRKRCVYCHQQDAFTLVGRALCADCAEKDRQKHFEKYASDPQKYRDQDKAYYNARKEKGLCVKCGKPKEPGNPRVRCLRCTKKLAAADHAAVERNRQVEQNYPRGANGICYICNRNPVMPGRCSCSECYPWLKENMLNARAAQNMESHPWNAGRRV